ncbi:RHS repeat-associated core domain-containing protein [Chryseobacterium lactis]|uniref:RHS repeat-associated core domain-containing protein n=5 Tax=Chryseobacterium lactis TaxID=1241981 RepID=A0ABM7B537_CHRLC|nr:RHS repeat-associated core domain-containing protein [Chryseobacterium lactis]AZB07251.1 RHS repeat-associated core domain-containing protein [Chryseobacterium lactis]
MVRHWHQVNGANKELLAENVYNELGQLQTKNVGNTTGSPLQSVNYAYNIRGWLTKINEPSNLLTKLFAYELRYNNPNAQFSGTAKYNGNISQAAWITQTDAVLRNYSYEYDPLNRLKEGRLWDAMNLDRGEYTETLTYDLNGNIGSLKRKGRQFPGYTAPENMDDLAYEYTGNRLTKVRDISENPSGYPIGGKAFAYDDNGNMTVQEDKGLTIRYNYLNLPQNILSPQGNTSYLYSADGVKVKKTAGSKVVDYLTGFQYENNTLQFFPTSEGYFDYVKNKYIYNYTDHLGNVRLSYMNGGSGIEIIEESNYYPFGLKHEGYNTLSGNTAYQYKYNGKELQETGMYDYGARFYMPDVGRWGVVDPLAEKMRRHSHYNYAFNNPIRFIDPDGRKPLAQWTINDFINDSFVPSDDITVNSKGKITNIVHNNKPNRFFDEKGKQLFFNDPKEVDKNSLKPGKYYKGDQLYHQISKGRLVQFMKTAGFDALRYNMKAQDALRMGDSDNAMSHKITALGIAKKESYGKADFATSALGPNYIYPEYNTDRRRPWQDTLNETTDYFRFGESNTLYNLYDGGNYMWGGWMHLNGFDKDAVKFGSNLNELMRGNMGDTAADQKSIFDGFNFTGY